MPALGIPDGKQLRWMTVISAAASNFFEIHGAPAGSENFPKHVMGAMAAQAASVIYNESILINTKLLNIFTD